MFFAQNIRPFVFAVLSSAALIGCASDSGDAAAKAEFDFVAQFHGGDAVKDISLTSLKLHLSEIRLVAKTSGGGNGAKFDPANPPEPYENCHANHCHIKGSSDTKSFVEIEAELSGGKVQEKDVLVLQPNRDIVLTSLTQPVEIESIAAGELPYGEVNEIRIKFDTFSLDATNRTTQKRVQLTNSHQHEDHVHTEPLELGHAVDIDVVQGKEKDEDIHLIFEVDAEVFGEVFGDDVDFADLMAEHSSLEIGGHDHEHHE